MIESSAQVDPPRPGRLEVWAGPVGMAAAGLAMLGWGWLKWPDVLVDFGQQLYIPWRLSEGAVLYRDLAYFHGPLAPYLNALWFDLFGTGLLTLFATNLVVLCLIAALLYRLLLRVGDRLSATAGGLAFMTLFAFSQYSLMGDFNYMAPYEHSVTYGMLFALAAIALLVRFLDRGRLADLAGSGFCLGLVFITKAELWLAAAGALASALGLTIWAVPSERRRALRVVAVFAAPALLAPLAAAGLLATAMPLDQALRGTLGSWPAILDGKAMSLRFHRVSMGTIDLSGNLMMLALMTGLEGGVLALALGLALLVRRAAWALAACAFAATWGLAWLILKTAPVDRIFLPLPVVAAAGAAIGAWRLWSAPDRADAARRLVPRMTFITFALLLLAKIFFNARIYHYGFALAMPATLLAVVALLSWIPTWIGQVGGQPRVFRAAALAFLGITALAYLHITALVFSQRALAISDHGDRFLADPIRGSCVNGALAEISMRVRADQTLAVLPEGIMLNYLARRVNPTPHTNFMPDGVAIFGEESILHSLQAHPPDFVVLAHKDTTDFGFPLFGRDYGRPIYDWIDANYQQVWLMGNRPLQQPDAFGIALLRKRNAFDGDPGIMYKEPR